LELCRRGSLAAPGHRRSLLKWPTLQSLKKARKGSPSNSSTTPGFPQPTLIEQRLERIDKAVPLSDELALLQS